MFHWWRYPALSFQGWCVIFHMSFMQLFSQLEEARCRISCRYGFLLWLWNDCWCQISWSECFKNGSSLGNFSPVSCKNPQNPGVSGSSVRWEGEYCNALKPWYAQKHLRLHSRPNLVVDDAVMAADPHCCTNFNKEQESDMTMTASWTAQE